MPAIFVASLFTLLNHSFLSLDWISNSTPLGWYLRVILHEPSFDGWPYVGLYPIIPWIGVMGLGWCFGTVIPRLYEADRRRLIAPIASTGAASILLFAVIRWLNGYGNLLPRNGGTLMAWLYVSKYPPSVAFLLWALGGMCLFLAAGLLLEGSPRFEDGLTGAVSQIGRTPLFFYLAHLWLYRLRLPGVTELPFYLEMWQTFIFWLVGLVILWRLSIWYSGVKGRHPRSILRYI